MKKIATIALFLAFFVAFSQPKTTDQKVNTNDT